MLPRVAAQETERATVDVGLFMAVRTVGKIQGVRTA